MTGAGGMVGSAIVRALVATRTEVRAHLGPVDAVGVTPIEGVTCVWGDMRDARDVLAMVDSCDAVVHAAGPPSVAGSFRHPAEHLMVHAVGAAHLANALNTRGCHQLVHISSAEVYAPGAGALREDAPLAPRSPYGIAKLAAESLLRVLIGGGPTELVILRPFSVYGPASPESSVVGRICSAVASGHDVELHDLRPVRDFVYVDDLAEAVLLGLSWNGEGPSPGVFNVCSGVGRSILELARQAVAASGERSSIREMRQLDRPAASQVIAHVGDPARAKVALGWFARTNLEAGLRAVVTAKRQGLGPRHP